jgi:hypothetical protein
MNFIYHSAIVLLMCCAGTIAAETNAPTTAPPARPRTAAELVREHRNSLGFFEGKTGKGSGFIADFKGQKFLLSNVHVIAGIKSAVFTPLDRSPVKIGNGSVAVGHDILALSVIAGGSAIPMVESVDKEVLIGDPVVVLGNAEGAGVINTLEGKIIGIGPERIEVDAPFVPGNSGSPIIHLPTGKVIGIASYMSVKKIGPREEKVRRFGYRLDSVTQWQAINWNWFYADADRMKSIEESTQALGGLFNEFAGFVVNARRRGVSWGAVALGNQDVKYEFFNKSARNREQGEKSLSALCLSDIQQAESRLSYDFFKRRLTEEKADRELLSTLFKEISGGVYIKRRN